MNAEHTSLGLPIQPYTVSGYQFGQRVRSRVILWARHLGEDVVADAGASVVSIGAGTVVWSEIRKGTKEKRNWGGIVIVEHIHKITGNPFYSLYGHITDISVQTGDLVVKGQQLGVVAGSYTPENGWWKLPHLHFGIYVGPWTRRVLPGYKRPFDDRTKYHWWREPRGFIQEYNQE